jgi:hypothetical protein
MYATTICIKMWKVHETKLRKSSLGKAEENNFLHEAKTVTSWLKCEWCPIFLPCFYPLTCLKGKQRIFLKPKALYC